MAFRQRTPTFRPQLSVRRVYETLQPRTEMKETPEAYLLHVYLPGFTKQQIKITLDDSSRMVRISGEKPIHGNRWVRFDQTYPVPENSVAESLEAKFEQLTLILKMQKKFIPQVSPKQEVETTQVKSPKGPSDKAVDEAKHEKIQETINPPPQESTTTKLEEPIEDKKSVSFPSPVKVPTDHFIPQKEGTSSQIPPETISNANNNPQKGQEEAIETKKLIGETQMVKEEFEPNPTSTETTKTQTDEKPPKGEEEIEPKPIVTTDTKKQLKEKMVETSVEDDEKEMIPKKELFVSNKPVKVMDKGKEAEPLAPKVQEKEKESCCRTPLNQEGKWSDEERHLLENIGAAVLVIAALGAYVSYSFASS